MGPRSVERGIAKFFCLNRSCFRMLQWGRALSSAESSSNSSIQSPPHPGLQWGRALSSAESVPTRVECRSILGLQWGRALSSAESRLVLSGRARHQSASMGPRSVERGIAGRNFRERERLKLLQWGRALSSAESARSQSETRSQRTSFNGAALCRARNPGSVLSSCSISVGFNGAALCRARNHRVRLHHVATSLGASMGPRSVERGIRDNCPFPPPCSTCFNGAALCRARNRPLCPPPSQPNPCFNGAALCRARNRSGTAYQWHPGDCFNGAALCRARNLRKRRPIQQILCPLQWGRALSSAESYSAKNTDGLKEIASMGPRSVERGIRLAPSLSTAATHSIVRERLRFVIL